VPRKRAARHRGKVKAFPKVSFSAVSVVRKGDRERDRVRWKRKEEENGKEDPEQGTMRTFIWDCS
jgi:hypothetical protein